MADYFFATVIQLTIPSADITPLERLILTHMFAFEPDGDGLYFFAEHGPHDVVSISAADLQAALTASFPARSTLRDYVAERMSGLDPAAAEVQLDLSGTSWEFFFQDIVRRSRTLRYLTAVSAFTCSKMRPDGFGGSATLITADTIESKSTSDILEDLITEMEDGRATPA